MPIIYKNQILSFSSPPPNFKNNFIYLVKHYIPVDYSKKSIILYNPAA